MRKKLMVIVLIFMMICVGYGMETKEKKSEQKSTFEKKYGNTVLKEYEFLKFRLPANKLSVSEDDDSEENVAAWMFKEKETWYLFSVKVDDYDEKTYKDNLVELGEVTEYALPGARRFKMGQQIVLKEGDCMYTEGCFLFKDKSVKMELYSPYTKKPDIPTEEILEDIIQTVTFKED